MRGSILPLHTILIYLLVTVFTFAGAQRPEEASDEGHSRTVWHPVNHHETHDEEWQRKIDEKDTQTLSGFPALKANPLLTEPQGKEDDESFHHNNSDDEVEVEPTRLPHDGQWGIDTTEKPASIFDRMSSSTGGAFNFPTPRTPHALQYERSGVPVSEHRGPYHPALHSVHYTTNHSDEERRDMEALRAEKAKQEEQRNAHRARTVEEGGNQPGRVDDDAAGSAGKVRAQTGASSSQLDGARVDGGGDRGRENGEAQEADRDTREVQAGVDEEPQRGELSEPERQAVEAPSTTKSTGTQNSGSTTDEHSEVTPATTATPNHNTVDVEGQNEGKGSSTPGEEKEAIMADGGEGKAHERLGGRPRKKVPGKRAQGGEDTVPKRYHPRLHHKDTSKTPHPPHMPIAPPGYQQSGTSSRSGGDPSVSVLSQQLSSLLSLWEGKSPTELELLGRKSEDWKTKALGSPQSRTGGWLSALGDRYTAAANHQVEGDVMLAKLLIFLSVNSNGGPNDIITGATDTEESDLEVHDPAFLCNHICWQRHPRGTVETAIKGAASVATRCELSPMAEILLRPSKPRLSKSLSRVCDEECIAMTAEENSPISACVAIPCSERCRVEGTRCTATLEHDWYAHGFCSSKCSPSEDQICEATGTSNAAATFVPQQPPSYASKCLWTRTCGGCLKQEQPTNLAGSGHPLTALEMQCINFDGECRPVRDDGTCTADRGHHLTTSADFFPCAAPYFEEAYPYGPYYTTVGGKPYKEVKNIRVNWNNYTIAVEVVMHNHRGATPECLKARFLVVDDARERKYRLEDREWQSSICAEHWDDRAVPWEADARTPRGDFDGHIKDMYLFQADQNPGQPASIRIIGEVPLMRAAKDETNVVHLTPDFNDYQVLLCLGPRAGYMSPLGDAALNVLGPWRLQLTDDLLETDVGIQREKEEGTNVEVPSPGMHTHGVLVP
ncbi:hypothetical protein FOZ60_014010 [Perkinsus olseni]|uniref:Uncharacterized protein n=3 Tax=Perkinsus olseni TaxID=32597 RepID=A0A7J6NB69_PEROL|nr:hypothetical protein FOZ60_014010 [Perkinsus olseni]